MRRDYSSAAKPCSALVIILVLTFLLSNNIKEQSRLRGSTSIGDKPVEPATLEREKDGTGELIGRHRETLICDDIKEGEGLNNIPNIAYWFNIPEDNTVISEYKDLEPNPKYITLHAGKYGLNNIRMVWETVVVFAAVTGRTIVLPPIGTIDFMKSIIKSHEGHHPFTFDYFYPMDELRKVVDVITTEEFLQREAITGNLGIWPSRKVYVEMEPKAVDDYFVEVANQYPGGIPNFNKELAVVFPFKPGEEALAMDPRYTDQDDFTMWLDKRKIKQYAWDPNGDDWSMAKVIHFKDEHGHRLLIPFYALMKHSNNDLDKYYHHVVRDRLHYHDKYFCKAGQVINMIREESTMEGHFHTMHIRRGDFQYESQRKAAEELLASTVDMLPAGSTVFIATDEKNTSFFEPFQERYNVKFLNDYFDRAGLSEIPTPMWSLIDAIIASHGDIFFGTWLSTFTGYITRMRGYLNHTDASSLYFDTEHTHVIEEEKYPKPSYWRREWKIAWENID